MADSSKHITKYHRRVVARLWRLHASAVDILRHDQNGAHGLHYRSSLRRQYRRHLPPLISFID